MDWESEESSKFVQCSQKAKRKQDRAKYRSENYLMKNNIS